MKSHNVKKIMFSSTGSVYGETEQIPTKSIAPFKKIKHLFMGHQKLQPSKLFQLIVKVIILNLISLDSFQY